MRIGLINLDSSTEELVREAIGGKCKVLIYSNAKALLSQPKDNCIDMIIYQFSDFSRSEYNDYKSLKMLDPAPSLIVTAPHFSLMNVFKIGNIGATDLLIQPVEVEQIVHLMENHLAESTASVRQPDNSSLGQS